MTPHFARWVASMALALAFAAPASAYNIVTNPSFAGNMTGWTADPSTTYDAANDATGLPGSGSARNSFAASGASTLLSIHQCIAAGPGAYTFGGRVLIPSGQAIAGSGMITVSYFSGPDCLTGYIGFNLLSTSTTGSFQTLSGPITAPAGTAHIWITGQNSASAAGTHIVNFDDFVLDNGLAAPSTMFPVPALGGLGLWLLSGLLALMGVVARRRWR